MEQRRQKDAGLALFFSAKGGRYSLSVIFPAQKAQCLRVFPGIHYEKQKSLLKNVYKAGRVENICKLLSDYSRAEIMKMLQNREMYLGEIAKALHLKNQVTSYHLDLLIKYSFVDSRNERRFVFYSINTDSIEKSLDAVKRKSIPASR